MKSVQPALPIRKRRNNLKIWVKWTWTKNRAALDGWETLNMNVCIFRLFHEIKKKRSISFLVAKIISITETIRIIRIGVRLMECKRHKIFFTFPAWLHRIPMKPQDSFLTSEEFRDVLEFFRFFTRLYSWQFCCLCVEERGHSQPVLVALWPNLLHSQHCSPTRPPV